MTSTRITVRLLGPVPFKGKATAVDVFSVDLGQKLWSLSRWLCCKISVQLVSLWRAAGESALVTLRRSSSAGRGGGQRTAEQEALDRRAAQAQEEVDLRLRFRRLRPLPPASGFAPSQ